MALQSIQMWGFIYLSIYLFVYLISPSRAASLASPRLNAACVRLLFLLCVCGAGRSRAYVGARQAGRLTGCLAGLLAGGYVRN